MDLLVIVVEEELIKRLDIFVLVVEDTQLIKGILLIFVWIVQ
jgi:hypothetical protein